MSSWIAAATSYSNHGVPMIPFYIYYSMFGFQRIGDLAWAAGDSRARGFLLGGTAGRTTLNGEGLQHEDGHSHVDRGDDPELRLLRPDLRLRGRGDRPGRPAAHVRRAGGRLLLPHAHERELPAPGDARGRARRGSCRACTCCARRRPKGAAARPAAGLGHDPARGAGRRRAARRGLRRRRRRVERARASPSCAARAWRPSAGTCCTRPRSRARSWVERAWRAARARWSPRRTTSRVRRPDPPVGATAPYRVLGTDGFGRSDYRRKLRRSSRSTATTSRVAALKELAEPGGRAGARAEAIETYGIDTERPAPWQSER